jgi:hypothetical protein
MLSFKTSVCRTFYFRYIFSKFNNVFLCFDVVIQNQIRDGLLPTDIELVFICDSVFPAPISTMGPAAWIHFHSDDVNTDTGFNIARDRQSGLFLKLLLK